MDTHHFKIIPEQFNLTNEPPQQIEGGPGGGHLCWKVKSENETFFLKQLDPMLDVNDKKIIARYELCESIAFRFSKLGIHAVYAIRNAERKSEHVIQGLPQYSFRHKCCCIRLVFSN